MKLNIRKGFFKTSVMNQNGDLLYSINYSSYKNKTTVIKDASGSDVYSLKKDAVSSYANMKYIFTDHETGNEFFARVKWESAKPSLYRFIFSLWLEVSIEAESFFGEIAIRRMRENFEICINGKVSGVITGNKIESDTIDSPPLLAVIYTLTNIIAETEHGIFEPNFAAYI